MVHTAQTPGTDPSDEFLTHMEHTICLSEGQLRLQVMFGGYLLSVEIKPQEYQTIQNFGWKKHRQTWGHHNLVSGYTIFNNSINKDSVSQR